MEFSVFVLIAAGVFVISGLRIIDQYERGVVLTLGKHTGTRSPGLTWVFPFVQRMIKADLRILTVDIPRQEVITKDNVTVNVDAVVYFRIKNADKAILEVQDYQRATSTYAQATMRDVVGEVDLDTLLTQRDQLGRDIKKIVDKYTDAWGIDVAFSGTQKCLSVPPGLAPITFSPAAQAVGEARTARVRSWYLDVQAISRYWGEERSYHHTAPISAIVGLHEGLRLVLEEGLETRWARHAEVGQLFQEHIQDRDATLLAADALAGYTPAHRLFTDASC
jgi:hypothetical protein